MRQQRPLDILMVEDNPGDADLTREALAEAPLDATLHVVEDGELAMAFMRRTEQFSDAPRPDLILLDLNLPRKDGREVLAELKADEDLKTIPVVVLTTSRNDEDVIRSYRLNANCYVRKPVDLDKFMYIMKAIEEFWLSVATLPTAD